MSAAYEVVVPTVGRPSLARLLERLASLPPAAAPARVWLVDDRPAAPAPDDPRLPVAQRPDAAGRPVVTLRSGGRGPAAARNLGWRAASAPWVVFLDDDVVPGERWGERLLEDLRAAGPDVGGVQGRIRVPQPADRRPTDWERDVAGLERARWATADLAYRRVALEQAGGFDERFCRNYREDADLALRVVAAGWAVELGGRETLHPVGRSSWTVSVARQRGNGDDALMRRLHGRDWRERAAAPPGRLPRHLATAGAGIAAIAFAAAAFAARAGGRGQARRRLAVAAAAGWAAGTAELAWARIAPGPRTAREVAAMAATSVALPFAASWHRLAGEWRWRGARPIDVAPRPDGATGQPTNGCRAAPPARPADGRRAALPAAVLFDRDGTLVEDVPYNGDPRQVVPRPGALDALAALRAAGVPTAVVSNQSGIARGLLTPAQVDAVNARADALLGGVGPWLVCPHGPDDGCGCRKPAPGLVLSAAAALGVEPSRCVVIGDVGADVEAARAAGARAVLVPTEVTRREEVAAAERVAPDLLAAVRMVLGEEGR